MEVHLVLFRMDSGCFLIKCTDDFILLFVPVDYELILHVCL